MKALRASLPAIALTLLVSGDCRADFQWLGDWGSVISGTGTGSFSPSFDTPGFARADAFVSAAVSGVGDLQQDSTVSFNRKFRITGAEDVTIRALLDARARNSAASTRRVSSSPSRASPPS